MTKTASQRRSPLISMLIFIFLVAAGLILTALLQLDINSFKEDLSSRLEQALNKPVKLGDLHLSFNGGISLECRNLRIGDDENFRLYVPQLSLTLKPKPLLFGEIVIDQILLNSPSLRLRLEQPMHSTKPSPNLEHLSLKTLQIRDGSLSIFDPLQQNDLEIENFNLVIHGLGTGLVSQLAITARIMKDKQASELNAFLELTRQKVNQAWRRAKLRGNISWNNPSALIFDRFKTEDSWGELNLKIGVQGIPADNVEVNAEIKEIRSIAPLIRLRTDWQSTATEDRLNNLRISLTGKPISGQLTIDHRGEEPSLSGQLKGINIDLAALAKELYPQGAPISGSIREISLTLNGPLHETPENPLAPLQSGYLKLEKIAYPLGPTNFSDGSLLLKLQNSSLRLVNGSGLVAQTPIRFNGRTSLLSSPPLEIKFDLNAAVDLSDLQRKSSSAFLKRQKMAGLVPIDFSLQGPMDKLSANLKIDFSKVEVEIGKLLKINPAQPFKLELNGGITNKQPHFNTARFNLGETTIELTGKLAPQDNSWLGRLQLSPLKLGNLQSFSPLFARLKLVGTTDGFVHFGPKNWEAQLNLQEGGARLTRIIGDLNRVNGVVKIDQSGLDFRDIDAHLGESPIHVSGDLKNWRAALLSLHVTSDELRARDLIFSNPHMKLQNLDGHLLINAGGIAFDPVQVRVENKTTARIQGQMHGYRDPHTALDIEAEEADILDIIKLFTGPRKIVTTSNKPNKASLEIKVKVKKGTLGSLAFENAQGTIIDRNRIFTLYPLDFDLGAGRSSARVEIDRLRNNLLKISGQVQNCDADRVYEMLFEQKGIFRGTLSGDFYLEGEEIGDHFWRTAQGGGHLQIRDGAMRELKGFAQIFSLLNVSQLFKFELPDMDEEGLPLSLLETSGRLTDGVLYFNDFKITSPAINISAVGQIDILHKTIDSTLGIKPLRTVDIILGQIPLFGWVLTGEDEALITALFSLKGPLANPDVAVAPASSVAKTALGIIGRTLGLPFRILQKTEDILTTPPRPETSPAPGKKAVPTPP